MALSGCAVHVSAGVCYWPGKYWGDVMAWSEAAVHDVQADVAADWVAEAVRDGCQYLESGCVPQRDGCGAGLDDGVELHGAVILGAGEVQDVLAEGPAGAAPGAGPGRP
jgi:hypothetical protein